KESTLPTGASKKASPSELSTLDVEEVKIPAWLEPLARNAATKPAPHGAASKAASSESSPKSKEAPASATPPRREARARKSPASVFGKTLLDSNISDKGHSGGRNRGVLAAAIAAVVLVIAAIVTWYLRQPLNLEQNAASATTLPLNPAPMNAASAAAEPSLVHPQVQTGAPLQDPVLTAKQASRPASEAFPVSPEQPKLQPAVISERIVKQNPSGDVAANGTLKSVQVIESELEPSKPTLGKVRLAKPKVGRNARGQIGGVVEPELEATNDQLLPNDDLLGAGLVSGSANQPAAPTEPTPIGGEVKPARMLSSIPPTYPPIARTQRVSGDVRIDALIGANGHVSSMKVVSGPSLLHQAAMDALRQWKYQPATLDGKPVPMHLTVTIQFRLQ